MTPTAVADTADTADTVDPVEEAERHLATAERERSAFFAEVSTGSKVPKPAEVLAVDSAVTVARLRLDGVRTAAAEAAEAERAARLAEIRASISGGEDAATLTGKRRRMVQLVEQIAGAYEELLAEIADHDAQVSGIVRELRDLQPLPDGMSIEGRSSHRVDVDGRKFARLGGTPMGKSLLGEPFYRALVAHRRARGRGAVAVPDDVGAFVSAPWLGFATDRLAPVEPDDDGPIAA